MYSFPQCICLGWDKVSFLHSSLYGVVIWISGESSVNAPMF